QWGILAINHVQHDGCDPDSTYNHSRNFVGRWLNWWVFNNGYHTAHHLRPGLHWSQLPALHAEIRDCIDPTLERRSLLLAAVEFYLWPARRPTIPWARKLRTSPERQRRDPVAGAPGLCDRFACHDDTPPAAAC